MIAPAIQSLFYSYHDSFRLETVSMLFGGTKALLQRPAFSQSFWMNPGGRVGAIHPISHTSPEPCLESCPKMVTALRCSRP
jgi:hypothetical protein